MRSSKSVDRAGLTLVEVLVCVGILAILVALGLPAVQQGREAARRAQCLSNLRQVGLANQSYLASSGVFPSPRGGPDVSDGGRYRKDFSSFTHILPYLDQQELFSNINFEVGLRDPYLSRPPEVGAAANVTVMAVSLATFLCPSDSGAGDPGWTGGTNYRVNLGAERWIVWAASPVGGPLSATGPFSPSNARDASVRDGLSQTVAFSEKLRGRVGGRRLNGRTDVVIGFVRGLGYSVDEALASCAAKDGPSEGFLSATGLTWFVGSGAQTWYFHSVGPNSEVIDCAFPSTYPTTGIIGARSNHPGGVVVGIADGSARFVSDSVSLDVWRALGTRAGREIIPDGY